MDATDRLSAAVEASMPLAQALFDEVRQKTAAEVVSSRDSPVSAKSSRSMCWRVTPAISFQDTAASPHSQLYL